MRTIEPSPCPEQRAVLEALGFEAQETSASDLTPWRSGPVLLTFSNAAKPTPKTVLTESIAAAIQLGEERRKNALKALLM